MNRKQFFMTLVGGAATVATEKPMKLTHRNILREVLDWRDVDFTQVAEVEAERKRHTHGLDCWCKPRLAFSINLEYHDMRDGALVHRAGGRA